MSKSVLYSLFFFQETSRDNITGLRGAHCSIGHLQVYLVKLEKSFEITVLKPKHWWGYGNSRDLGNRRIEWPHLTGDVKRKKPVILHCLTWYLFFLYINKVRWCESPESAVWATLETTMPRRRWVTENINCLWLTPHWVCRKAKLDRQLRALGYLDFCFFLKADSHHRTVKLYQICTKNWNIIPPGGSCFWKLELYVSV